MTYIYTKLCCIHISNYVYSSTTEYLRFVPQNDSGHKIQQMLQYKFYGVYQIFMVVNVTAIQKSLSDNYL